MDWEFDILYAIQSIRTPFLDKVMAFLSTIGNAGALWIVKIPFDSSFPSGHTLNGITAAVTLMFIDKRMGIPAIVLAVLIAFSRMYNFMHFPTDILAGAVLGVVSAVFVNFLFKRAGN